MELKNEFLLDKSKTKKHVKQMRREREKERERKWERKSLHMRSSGSLII